MLPRIDTILFATDLSPAAPSVFRHAVALAQRFEARIILLHVLEPLGHTARSLVRNVVPGETLEALEQEGLSKVCRELRARLEAFSAEEPGAEGRVGGIRIVEGPPATTILDEAASAGAQAIVMGTHGQTEIEKILLGSVANKVVQQSRIPVLLVPVPAEA